MSWNGTVYCGHCGHKGHNRRGCPKLKEQMTERLANNPDDYWAKSYFKKKEGSKVRKCSFCGTEGHNRATCVKLKETQGLFEKANEHYLKEVVRVFDANGIREGALVQVEQIWHNGEYHNNQLGVVVGFDWDYINFTNHLSGELNSNCMKVRLTGATAGKTLRCRPKVETDGIDTFLKFGSQWRAAPVMSPGSGSLGAVPKNGKISKPAMRAMLKDDTYSNRFNADTMEWVDSTETEITCQRYWDLCKKKSVGEEGMGK